MATIQIISDLHLEEHEDYDRFKIEPRTKYLALLGDIGNVDLQRNKCLGFLREQLCKFRIVFFVPGGEEVYGSSWGKVTEILEEFEQQTRQDGTLFGEFVLLNKRAFQIPKTSTFILGCSLFSSVQYRSDGHPREGLNQPSRIKYWNTSDHHRAHVSDLEWLNEMVASVAEESGHDSGFKIAIFTHWSPSRDERAVDPLFEDESYKCGFSTDLSQEECYLNRGVVLWAFGHTHYNCDFFADRRPDALGVVPPIRILTNQRGYSVEPAVGFDGDKTVEI
ncbi:hypothetical protein J3458_021215 [Metarhizium acridum]|uniref:uncharacterized protein n=1 Tax=Metarhizium acridum TaxID=92637 RepID=UPI001C6C61D3|nr:hypothetical protein J3458_021147 [Metarhizium acridum]KAG8406380.1 hypothetical protein J3458_021215 [Metarhizium acridum]